MSHRASKPHQQGRIGHKIVVETEFAGESEQISRAEYVSEDAWSGQSPDGGVIWILF